MNHASLFSGIGGAEVAASMMGWQNLFHCEIQEFPRKVLQYWFPNSESYEDITKTDFTKWHGKVDVLTGGFPCQPFSLAGRRKGADDNRYLWPQMLRAIRQIHPTWVVGENVNGIKTMVESCQVTQMGRTDYLFEENYLYREESRFTLDKICADLEAEGYSVQPIVIPACAIGAPHRRDRVWIVARKIPTTPSHPNSSNDSRRPEEIQGKSQKERLSERNDIRKPGFTSDVLGHVAYALQHRSHEVHQDHQSNCPDGARTNSLGGQRSSPHSNGFGWDKGEHEYARSQKTQQGEFQPGGADSPQSRWRNFPTQSPVCRGNDGIPFDVDSLTISFPKWRQESIKAYGNAWVPQVAYEIFRAIEAEENK